MKKNFNFTFLNYLLNLFLVTSRRQDFCFDFLNCYLPKTGTHFYYILLLIVFTPRDDSIWVYLKLTGILKLMYVTKANLR